MVVFPYHGVFLGVTQTRRDAILFKVLTTLGLANHRTAKLLQQLHLITSTPTGVEDQPLRLSILRDQFAQVRAKRAEMKLACATLANVTFGEIQSAFYGEVMPFRFHTMLDRLLFRPLQALRHCTNVALAHTLATKGWHALASYVLND
jgi:hypothetical protein